MLSMSRHMRLPALAVLAVVLASCDTSIGLQPGFLSGPFTYAGIKVLVHNSTGAEFTVQQRTIAYGSSGFVRSISDSNPLDRSYTFDVERRGVALVRVSYRVLKFPKRIKDEWISKEATITVQEPSPSTFSAAAARVDTLWIQVLGTTPLPLPGI